ncbi:uncharacterized protein LOC119391836 [Rhipicephalus sanguineus]|uniref:uncharacterized protein LOC119391836 n=1 Tax=Rhipicephalus sanguineus TaxID=34632 RepID=UPI0018933813|nr:uncharacterized protein LOC119391836 [Rhipicephalus sanguineus]
MASVERLRKNHGVVRASVTRTLTLLTDELQASVADAAQVESHIAYLIQKNAELVNLNKDIFDATDDDAYEEELEAAEDYDRKVCYAVSRARFFLREAANKATATSTSTPEATLPNVDAGGASTTANNEVGDPSRRVTEMTPSPGIVPRHRTVVLPKLQIPTSSGALRDWQSFWDHFSATIHLNDELLQIEKFKYLLSYFTGAAKRAIEGIRLTEDNYSIAIKTLTQRFGRRDLLINEHVDHLLALAPVKSSAEVEKLRLLFDKVQFRVSALTGLGVSPDQYNVVLNRVLMKCLPDDLAILYRQKAKEAPQDTSGVATPEERAR